MYYQLALYTHFETHYVKTNNTRKKCYFFAIGMCITLCLVFPKIFPHIGDLLDVYLDSRLYNNLKSGALISNVILISLLLCLIQNIRRVDSVSDNHQTKFQLFLMLFPESYSKVYIKRQCARYLCISDRKFSTQTVISC